MKKLVVLFAFLFAVSTSFISCRETEREVDEVEEVGEDVGDEIEETGEELEDDY